VNIPGTRVRRVAAATFGFLAPVLTAGTGVTVPLALLATSTFAPTAVAAQEVGPPSGSLVIVGGALSDPAIVERFIELAGGPDAPIVVVPTAGGAEDYDQLCSCLNLLRRNGATDLTVLHTSDPAEADTEVFVRPLRRAQGVWFTGGRQWRIADSYLGTLTEEAFRQVLERGGVIGGSSAGASIQGSLLVRGDTESNTVMLGDHLEGFGYLRNVGIDQHLLRRNRQFDMLEVIAAYPELLGIGLDENTAIVVQGDQFEVMGQGYVAIYDATATIDTGGDFYLLAPGDRFDLAAREATRPSRSFQPLDRVERRSGGGESDPPV
jgi:cyanophycinase